VITREGLPVKVAHLVTSFAGDPGLTDRPGDELVDLVSVAGETGVETVVVVLGSSGDRWDVARLRRLGVPVVELGLAPWDPRAVPQTVRALREHGVELVHAHRRQADVVGALASRRMSVPMVSTLYSVENLPINGADRLRRTAKILLRRRVAARTIAISHLQRERYRRFSGTDRGLVVVPNGVLDPVPLRAVERERVRRARSVDPDGLLAVSAAPMSRGQGQDLLLDSVAAVPASVPLTVVLVGDGPLRPWLVSRVEADDVLSARVRFEPRDPHDDGREIIGAADLFLHTTRSAALPLPLLRAAGLGVPAIASHVGGVPEIVGRATGVLVPLDADAIADAVVRLGSDAELRARLGAGARRRFLANFEAHGWAVRLRGVYDEALARLPAEPVGRPVGSGPVTLPPGTYGPAGTFDAETFDTR
jgi:glycosyltransferase involved in cell wall biosynthesis